MKDKITSFYESLIEIFKIIGLALIILPVLSLINITIYLIAIGRIKYGIITFIAWLLYCTIGLMILKNK